MSRSLFGGSLISTLRGSFAWCVIDDIYYVEALSRTRVCMSFDEFIRVNNYSETKINETSLERDPGAG